MIEYVRKGYWMPKGELHPRHKLTEKDVREIRRRYRTENITQTELGRIYGVSQNRICKIVTGTSWWHIPLEDDDDV